MKTLYIMITILIIILSSLLIIAKYNTPTINKMCEVLINNDMIIEAIEANCNFTLINR